MSHIRGVISYLKAARCLNTYKGISRNICTCPKAGQVLSNVPNRHYFLNGPNGSLMRLENHARPMCTDIDNNNNDVRRHRKRVFQRKKTDWQDNAYLTVYEAQKKYALYKEDLDNVEVFSTVRSAYPDKETIKVYRVKDLEAIALKKHGSKEEMEKQKFLNRRSKKGSWTSMEKLLQDIQGPKRVVTWALAVNGVNAFLKTIVWYVTRSDSMFAEMMHSIGDTINQAILLVGLNEAEKAPDDLHPYGFANYKFIGSLISSTMYLVIGVGASVYHGVQGLLHPHPIESPYLAMGMMTVSLVTESVSLSVAIQQIKKKSEEANMGFFEYFNHWEDPTSNSVFAEDLAAVTSGGIAICMIGASHITGNSMYDSAGSICIGGLMFWTARKIQQRNADLLVGRSVPGKEKEEIIAELSSFRTVSVVLDVKAIIIGPGEYKLKAEVEFDGKELSNSYLASLDENELNKLFERVELAKDDRSLENVYHEAGHNLVSEVGKEINRIEKELKKKFPKLRHIDIEVN